MTNSGRCYCASNIILAKEDLRGTLQKVREVPMRTVSAKHSKNHLKKGTAIVLLKLGNSNLGLYS